MLRFQTNKPDDMYAVVWLTRVTLLLNSKYSYTFLLTYSCR